MTEQEVNDWEALLLLAMLCNADEETIKQIKLGNKKLKDLIQAKINKLQEKLKDD